MKIFLSWSGIRSRTEAEALSALLEGVLDGVTTWMSSVDIRRGTQFFDRILNSLREADYAVAVITPENIESVWINFESGMALGTPNKARIGILCAGGLGRVPTGHPLGGFESTIAGDKKETAALIRDISLHLERPQASNRLQTRLNNRWRSYQEAREIPISSLQERTELLPPFLKSFYTMFPENKKDQQTLSRLAILHSQELYADFEELERRKLWNYILEIRKSFRVAFELSGNYKEGIRFRKFYLRAAKQIHDPIEEDWIRLKDIAWLQVLDGDYAAAEKELRAVNAAIGRHIKRAKTKREMAELVKVRFYCQRYLGVVEMRQDPGDDKAYSRASRRFRAAQKLIAVTPRGGRTELHAKITQNFGNLALVKGDYNLAQRHYRSALGMFRRIQDEEHITIASINVARAILGEVTVNHNPDSLAEAEQLLLTALLNAVQMGWADGQARAHFYLGDLYAAQASRELARREYQSAHRMYQAIGDRRNLDQSADRLNTLGQEQ